MTEQPHVVGVVGNDIVNDARVRKAAVTAARAGFRSTILCYTNGESTITERFDDVDVMKIPVDFKAHVKNGRTPTPLRPFNATELAGRHGGPRVYQQMKRRRLESLIADPTSDASPFDRLRLIWIRFVMLLRHDSFRLRRKSHVSFDRFKAKTLQVRRRLALRMTHPFRDGVPNIADYEVTFGPILESLRPDLIHAHDYHMIGLAVTAARNLRATGRATKVLYDAHELIEGLSYPARVIEGWLDLEHAFIKEVDAITGVSPEQADRIQRRYQLEESPTVILNAPTAPSQPDNSPPTIKDDLPVRGRILVYHGNVSAERGVGTLVDALHFLPRDVHVAVLAPVGNKVVEDAVRRSEAMGVGNRFHSLPYAPADRLLHYLSTADLAVIPYLRTGNNDIALPNKLFESIQAGLPVLVSDMASMSRLVREWGVGDVFEAESENDLAVKAVSMLDNLSEFRSRITPEVKRMASWDSQATKLARVYGALLETPTPEHLSFKPTDFESRNAGRTEPRPTKLAIGPRNMAGQAFAIAAAVQEHLGIPAVSYSVQKDDFGFPTHHQVSIDDWRSTAWQQQQRRILAHGFTHVIAESGTGMLGALNGGFIDEQLSLMLEDGLHVAVLLHGSEIRDPIRHRNLPYSPYRQTDDLMDAVVKANNRLRRHLEKIDVPVFVTTPDLLEDIEASWLPVVVTGSKWLDMKPPFQSPVPVVLHMPTSSLMKGSEYVDPVLRKLESEGRVRYLRPNSAIRSADVPKLIEEADIVVDQLVIGAYGLMSCQAMAAGRIAIANVRDIGSLGSDCPVIHCDPDSFRDTMMALLSESKTWTDIGDQGLAYIHRYHDGEMSATTLKPFLSP